MRVRLCGVGATWAVACAAGAFAVLAMRPESLFVVVSSPIEFLRLEFGLSILAAPFLALLAMLSIAVGLWSLRRGRPADIALIALFALTMLGVLVARSVAAFFLMWEAMSLVSAFLVASQHERRKVRRATLTYLIVAQGGALCVLAGLCILAIHAGSTSFLAMAAQAGTLASPLRAAAFVLALLGFGSKAGLLPLHFWLPRAHPAAPANASAMLSGVMLKVAIYGLCLVTLELAAPAPLGWGLALMLLGTLSAIAGVLYALVDHDLKRLLAYHSIENVGIITIGLGVALVALAFDNGAVAGLALVAALFHTINHGLFKGLLFLGAGTVADVEGTIDLERLGGLWGHLVWTAPFFLIGCVAIAGLPPLNGFASEWMTFQALVAAFEGSAIPVKLTLLASIAGLALTSGLAAACFVKVFGIVFLGRSRRQVDRLLVRERFDASASGLGFLAVLCVAFGLAPALAVVPLGVVAAASLGTAPLPLPTLPFLSVTVVALPLAGVLFVLLTAVRRGVRYVPTWTCGSPVTAAAQYTATAFSKPLRTIFAFLLLPERRSVSEFHMSRWFPSRIRYRTGSRYVLDEAARRFAALTLRGTRRSRALQSGSLRLYLAYAMAAFIFVVAVIR
jgi:hydrogenase-4 component B